MRLIATIVNFSKLFDSRPIFETLNEKLKWVGLYNLTTFTLGKKLAESLSLVETIRIDWGDYNALEVFAAWNVAQLVLVKRLQLSCMFEVTKQDNFNFIVMLIYAKIRNIYMRATENLQAKVVSYILGNIFGKIS